MTTTPGYLFYFAAVLMDEADEFRPAVMHNVYRAENEEDAATRGLDDIMKALVADSVPTATLHSYSVKEVPENGSGELIYCVSLLIVTDLRKRGKGRALFKDIGLACGFVETDDAEDAIEQSRLYHMQHNGARMREVNGVIHSGLALPVATDSVVRQ